MKFLDLLRMSSSNLWKRKVRTILTVLGVVIGVASIVVMISLGLGLSRSMMAEYESYGSLTQITVYDSSYYGGNTSEEEPLRLDDALIETIKGMDHVKNVYPVLQMSALAKYGGYMCYLQIQGMPIEAIESLGMTVGEGALPSRQDEELKFFYGSQVIQDFYNEKTGSGYWETNELPDIDLMKDPIFVIFDTDAYWQSQNTGDVENVVAPPKKYLINTCGVEQASEDGWTQYGWYTVCDIEKLMPELKKIFKNKVIPGQPSTKTGKPYKEIFYNSLTVDVDEMENVTAIQTALNDMGYQANSNAEWIESSQKSMGYVQAVLGGIGAVSLFVAAIGITNTMMMSIYERTKEIGVMKVLGCDLRNIRTLFLLEAGFIGFIGGIIGLILSYSISGVINKIASGAAEYTNLSSISYIPIWLALVSLGFAVLVGMIAGFFPALRAMKLSPLAAIHNE